MGHRDYSPHATELQSIEHVATVMYHLWNLQTPGALAFAGLIHLGDQSTLHFLGFPVDSEQFPSLVWCDIGLVAPLVTALWLPPVSTVGDFCQALDIGDRIPEFSTMAVETDGLQYLLDDRFKPRVGRLYFLRPVHQPAEDEVAFFQRGIDKKSFSSVLIDAEHGLCQADGVWTPPTLQARPNQDIRIEFDQDLPITRRTPEGEVMIGRIIPPPRWEEHSINRAAVAAGAQYSFWTTRCAIPFVFVKNSSGCGMTTLDKVTPCKFTLCVQHLSHSLGFPAPYISSPRSTGAFGVLCSQCFLQRVNWRALNFSSSLACRSPPAGFRRGRRI